LSNIIDIPHSETLDPALKASFRQLQMAERSLSGLPAFTEARASSFPLCPRAYNISRRLPRKRRPDRTESFMSEAATLMGTALHLVAQKWFGLIYPENWYGNWECVWCHKIRHNRVGPQHCRCGRPMVYKEYLIQRQKGVLWDGHPDGILKQFNGLNYLIDFKGSYQDKMRKVRLEGRPQESHYCQTNSYACAINDGKVDVGDLGKIDKILIIYIERGRPHILWEPVQVSLSRSVYRKTTTLIKAARRSLRDLVLPKGFCLTAEDYYARYCPWSGVCFSSRLESMLRDRILPERKFKPRREDVLNLLLRAASLEVR
jgi:hypothetical protein